MKSIVKVKIEEGVIHKKEKKVSSPKILGRGETKCKITRTMVCSSKISEIIHAIDQDFFQMFIFFYSMRSLITPSISYHEIHMLITI